MNNRKIFYIIFFLIFCSKFSISNADEIFNKGREIFLNQGNCASCHALSDVNSSANIGPNLNEIRPSLEIVLAIVKDGRGVMPSYQDILSSDEIKAVAHYVSKASNQ